MKAKNQLSRRDFVKSSALASTALAGSALIQGCGRDNSTLQTGKPGAFPYLDPETVKPDSGVTGLLFSQIGYEPGYPVRILVRLPGTNTLSESATCRLVPSDNEKIHKTDCTYWGELWDSHWWVAEFNGIDEAGTWTVEVIDRGSVVMRDRWLRVAEGILWNETVPYASVDMLERRKHFTKVGAGWQDAGTLWVESCAQSAMITGLTELLEKQSDRFDEAFTRRIHEQLVIGCDYLVMTGEKARELGYPAGALSHDLLGHEEAILPNDAVKAIVALYRTVRLLPEEYAGKKVRYLQTADQTYRWLRTTAKPMGGYGFAHSQRGIDPLTSIPGDEFQTRDLVLMCWGALEKWKTEGGETIKDCFELARQIMKRQIPKNQSESGYYGHFREYESLEHSEKSWTHGIVRNEFGADIGQFYPNYLVPFIEILNLWPQHEEAGEWRKCLEDFTYGYLVPACRKNPFGIVPLGIFGDEGALWFGGPFHGTNAIYGYTAALALELGRLFGDEELKTIAYGNMQWLAGLNPGITRNNLEACVVFSTDVPAGTALPASMMCGVGQRWAGTWFQTRGVICNGFSTGKQFQMDVEPLKINDRPESFTDEDWIPHSAGWLTGLVRL